MRIKSWGGVSGEVKSLAEPGFSTELPKLLCEQVGRNGSRSLVIGNLRSYGDEVIAMDGIYIKTLRCDRILKIDPENETVTVECGVRIDSLQRRLMPFGLILPVTPGTAFLTVGGAIANDVHGKNHHIAGTFGCFVERFELVRSSGEALRCSRNENNEFFAATIGGMGLTGVITWAILNLRRASQVLQVTSRRFKNLAEFFKIDETYKDQHEYAVAWIDCLAKGDALGRGVYSFADHIEQKAPSAPLEFPAARKLGIPFSLPFSPINSKTLGVLNAAYWRSHTIGTRRMSMAAWMYPLDSIANWNRLYGLRGFYQFQCVVPAAGAQTAILAMLSTVADFKQGSVLAVLKNFGGTISPGLMSFPMSGTTLALDFPHMGEETLRLLMELQRLAAAAGGRLYAAKDGCSPEDSLERGYPNFAAFQRFVDPGLGSAMARRQQLID